MDNRTLLNWSSILKNEKKKYYFINIINHLFFERQKKMIFPPKGKVFNAFVHTQLYDIKVVILGQDPYYKINQAHGLAFSVENIVKFIPSSLKNIQKEIISDLGQNRSFSHGCLTKWALQGVFLLNSVLTVEAGKPGSHYKLGWERFTNKVISIINEYCKGVVFLLWGSYAQKKICLIDRTRHYILLAPHPSPLSAYRGFFGCRHFSKTNKILKQQNKSPINWFF
ncbi:uracil-DNA glycosylase [Buchnera aphidicola str. Bp (Baizongia pistaciae)]|uniref:Uracil-DNA glycosylase n=1 Tax=Buchnera aphidicola subsp. Baizongia pistaciae (strain Bp) TaxID=224915 RepID=UNG_BUCBP|nr:uracil-DNA glycosylase [Buchnera aphidicola]P59465.1 RecName: Full=Uracil-DNA glycosylase; Short=UDG [Buchnera aphidicola str. Bp (Baizongia pistaciae)]AAO26905.1 uracil-DNA glycosylase [Buchnera aphidicola str. Bp (Baizongia pistaciae)]